MASTAILTWATAFSVQQLNAAGAPVGPLAFLQTQKMTPKRTVGKIDLTNCNSPSGHAEFAPGVIRGEFAASGIIDAAIATPGSGFDVLWTSCMDQSFYSQCIFYLAKPLAFFPAGEGVFANPVRYTGTVLWTEASMDFSTSSEGSVGKFEAQGMTVGSMVRAGTDLKYVTAAST